MFLRDDDKLFEDALREDTENLVALLSGRKNLYQNQLYLSLKDKLEEQENKNVESDKKVSEEELQKLKVFKQQFQEKLKNKK